MMTATTTKLPQEVPMHRIKIDGLTPQRTPSATASPLPTASPLGGLVAANLAATRNGQCRCGQIVLGVRYEADCDTEVTSNLPCGHETTPSAGQA
ncbi:hypothetical protein [Streptomyces sp. NPDC058612]|uniref:hypothetical protein n=1 Tax=Streptomyces sp. NPDC058612 TaxID=3346555 RepID=UPI00364840CD